MTQWSSISAIKNLSKLYYITEIKTFLNKEIKMQRGKIFTLKLEKPSFISQLFCKQLIALQLQSKKCYDTSDFKA